MVGGVDAAEMIPRGRPAIGRRSRHTETQIAAEKIGEKTMSPLAMTPLEIVGTIVIEGTTSAETTLRETKRRVEMTTPREGMTETAAMTGMTETAAMTGMTETAETIGTDRMAILTGAGAMTEIAVMIAMTEIPGTSVTVGVARSLRRARRPRPRHRQDNVG